jgi:hypothetical protein
MREMYPQQLKKIQCMRNCHSPAKWNMGKVVSGVLSETYSQFESFGQNIFVLKNEFTTSLRA